MANHQFKRLIINPSPKDTETYTVLIPGVLIRDVFDKCLRTTEQAFRPMTINQPELALLIGNIEYKVISLQNWTGRDVKTYEEATQYLTEVANAVYGDGWNVKILKNEVMYGPERVYAIFCDLPEKVQQICEALKYVADVQVNPTQAQTASKAPGKTEVASQEKKPKIVIKPKETTK